jgi:prevent-host-death family protein
MTGTLELWPSDGYIVPMSSHSIAEAKNRFSELVDLALRGEEIVITRHGQPVIAFRPVAQPAPGPVTTEDLAWLDSLRVQPRKPLPEGSGSLLARLRDEDWP